MARRRFACEDCDDIVEDERMLRTEEYPSGAPANPVADLETAFRLSTDVARQFREDIDGAE
jgi:hypothetical protein